MPGDKRVLVTGGTGLLGRQVVEAFKNGWTVLSTGFIRAVPGTNVKVNLEDPVELEAVLREFQPDVVVHCAAQRFPDKVEDDPEGARRLNVEVSRSLAELCAKANAILIYISTDYVFPGKPGEAPYEADATPVPPNLYGQTKLDGELAVRKIYAEARKAGTTTGRGVILRVPVLYGRAEKPAESAVNTLLDTVNKVQTPGIRIKMDHWSIRYPTNTEDVARVLADIAVKYKQAGKGTKLPEVLQFSSEDRVTKYEICQQLADVMGVNIDGLEPVTTGGSSEGVQRPYDCHLSTKALKDLDISVYAQDFLGWWRRELKAYRH